MNWLFSSQEISLPIKLIATLFVGVLVPVYWRHYGPANFLWFSDLALLMTTVALWLESPVLASMQAVSVVLLEFVWIADFLIRLTTGLKLVGIAAYMFKNDEPLYVRSLSLFHLFLPFLLLWLVYRFGYDCHAWMYQSVLAWVILLVCYFFTEPSKNINWVFGPDKQPQSWVPSGVYLAFLMIFLPACVYFPTHLALRAIRPEACRSNAR